MDRELQIIKISPNYVIKVSEACCHPLSKATLDEVERVWQERKRDGCNLFNGTILSCRFLGSEGMEAHFIEYKRFVAQQSLPGLRGELGVRPVCVSGIVCAGDQILLGKRAAHVNHYPGCYELVPSGGIDSDALDGDQVDIKKQFLIELGEEAGISAAAVNSFELLFLVDDQEREMIEICAAIDVDPSYAEQQLRSPTAEYDELVWMGKQELASHLTAHSSCYVPLTAHLSRWII